MKNWFIDKNYNRIVMLEIQRNLFFCFRFNDNVLSFIHIYKLYLLLFIQHFNVNNSFFANASTRLKWKKKSVKKLWKNIANEMNKLNLNEYFIWVQVTQAHKKWKQRFLIFSIFKSRPLFWDVSKAFFFTRYFVFF